MRPATTAFGGDFRPTSLDLGLSAALALGLPFLCAALIDLTGGALAGLLVYYLLACVALVRWRKGALDYGRPARWPWLAFAAGLAVAALITWNNWGRYPNQGAAPLGLWLTLLIWAPLNGALEQLSWLYTLDAWRNRWAGGPARWAGLIAGVLLLVALVTLIHLVFWARFLPAAAPGPRAWLSIPLNLALTATYAWNYYAARSLWPTFIVHTLVDIQLVALAGYSLLPDL